MLPKIHHYSGAIVGTIAFFATALAFFAPAPLAAQTASSLVTTRINNPIDENSRVTFKGTVHPLANRTNDRGLAPDNMPLDRITLFFKRSDAQESALKQLIGDLHAPGSPSYHQWLTPEQFGKQFGPSDQDLATVRSWLSAHGFSVTKVNAGRQSIEFSGNVAQFRDTFHAQIHKYAVKGETHYANANDPQIPAALSSVIGGFASLNNFRIKSNVRKLGEATYNPATGKTKPQWTIGSAQTGYNFVLSPGDFAVQYDLNPLYTAGTDGTGQTIAVVNDSNINVYLVNQFRSLFGLPANPPQVIIDGNDPGVDGTNNPDGPNDDSHEAYLDVEWAGAVAPKAQVDLVIGADTALELGIFLALEHTIYGNIAPVVSVGFSACEYYLGPTNIYLNNLYEQGATQGQTILVSTGDNGSAGCDNENTQFYAINGQQVSGLASTPYNVAVGGTDFYYSAWNQGDSAISAQLQTYWNFTPSNSTPAVSIQGVIPEQPWNESQYGLNILDFYGLTGETSIAGGGGGASNSAVCSKPYDSGGNCTGALTGYPKPSWQTGAGVPADSVRDIPDVSLFASNGVNESFYPICYSDADCQPAASGGLVQFTGIGGTSASTPAFAGIMALVNQKYGPQGQANFVLYPLATQYPTAFHDVTNGTISVPCNINTTSFGYDPFDCIAVSNPITVDDPNLGTATEGQIGKGIAQYNATTGYDLATGLGTVDANVLVSNWGNVTFKTSTVTLTPSLTSFVHGTQVKISGGVKGGTVTAYGSVALMTDSTEPVQQNPGVGQFLTGQPTTFPLYIGSYSALINYLPGGTYDIWGQYSGDGINAPATSQKTQISVTPEDSDIYFNLFSPAGTTSSGSIAPGSSVDYGTQVVLSAQVAPSSKIAALISCFTNASATCPVFGIPTGTVTFNDRGTNTNTAVINAEGDASYSAPLAVGSHSIMATYSGDNSYNKSAAAAVAFYVNKDTPAIGISASNQTSNGDFITGQPTVVNIEVLNGAAYRYGNPSDGVVYPVAIAAPTGTVTVAGVPGGTLAGTLSPGVDPAYQGAVGIATVTIPANTPSGNPTITVNYSGDSNYNATSTTGQISIVSTGGLASTTTATMTGSISPSTSITITGTVTGQSGSSAPAGGVLLYSSGYTITEVGLTPVGGDVSAFSLTLDSRTLFQGTNFVTLQYTGDATYAPSAFQLTNAVVNPLSDFSMVPQSTTVPVFLGNSATDTINVSSTNGFAGTVNFTCTAATVTCSVTPTATISAGGTSPVTLTINGGSTAGNYNVLVTGTDSTGQFVHTLAIQVAAALVPTFTLSNSRDLTIQPGTKGYSTLTVTPVGGYLGQVALTCSVAGPTQHVICGPTPRYVTLTGTSAVTSTLVVAAPPNTLVLNQPLNKLFAVGSGSVLALVVFFGIPARRRSWRKLLVVLTFATFVGLGIGCGVNTTPIPQHYVVTVTGTSGGITQTVTVNVTVQR